MAKTATLLLVALALMACATALPSQPKHTYVKAPFSNIISSENNPVAAFIPNYTGSGYTMPEGYAPNLNPYPQDNGDDNGNDNGDDDDDINQ